MKVMRVVELGGDPLQTRALFLWGVTSSVEEFDSSKVSLQACLTGLTQFRRRGLRLFLRRSLPRLRQGRAHNFFPTASVQDVHILSDAVQAFGHLVQHLCRRVGVGARRTPSGPPLTDGQTGYCAAPSAAPTTTAPGRGAISAASARLPSSGWPMEVTVRGCKPMPQTKRPVDGVFSLHRHGPRSYRGQCDATGLQDGSSGRDGAAVTGPGLSWRLLPEPSVFTATLPSTTSVGPNCSDSPLLRLPVAGDCWLGARRYPHPLSSLLRCSTHRTELPCSDTPLLRCPAARAY